MKVVRIIRDWQDKTQTLGRCTIYDEEGKPIFSCMSLERGWRDNESRVSCVPLGNYIAVLEYSDKFDTDLWELKNVPNRSECKFHSANYWFQLNGCIALGRSLADINKDGYNDVTSSRNTMKSFHKALESETRIEVIITK